MSIRLTNKYNFRNKKVLIFGLGLNDGGLGMAKFFASQGAILTITDNKTEEILAPTIRKLKKYKTITYHLGGHLEQDFIDTDFVVRNPSVKPSSPYLQLAQKHKKPILMELPLFMKLAPCKIIGVTGTKGKSTTSSLIYQILRKNKQHRVFLAGNIGKSAIALLPKIKKTDWVILELSSFQLDSFDFSLKSPHISVITNLKNDHVDWHGSLENYHQAKLNISKYQTPKDFTIINLDDPNSLKAKVEIRGKVVTISTSQTKANFYSDGTWIFENQKKLFQLKTKLFLHTNLSNILQAVAVARLQNISLKIISSIISRYKNLPGRLEYLGKKNGVDIYNDTTATNPEAVANNLESLSLKYGSNIILLAGGMDKLFDYSILKEPILKYTKGVVLFEGTGSEKIKQSIIETNHPIYSFYGTMSTAFTKAIEISRPGYCLVLSPGATSFNMFQNEFDRGAQFNAEFKKS